MLASTHHVVALDLSGHGDSAQRETYSLDQPIALVTGLRALLPLAGSTE